MNTVAEAGLNTAMPSQDALDMIDRLIRFPTVSRDSNLGLIEYARDFLEHLGAKTRLTYDSTRQKANLFATLGDGPKPGLVLSGHTDVVPVDGQAWDSDPFIPTIREGRLFARGSADMKGFIGIALTRAPKYLAAIEAGRLTAPVHFALSYDEEIGCLGVRGLIKDLADIGLVAAGCIVGEPTLMQPIVAHKGTNRFRCAVRGREAHSSYVTHGVNAIEYAARMVVFVRSLADRLAQLEARDYGFTVPYTTLSTGLIRGGIAANVVPKDCEFQFDMRTLPNASAEALYGEIRQFAATLEKEMKAIDPVAAIELEWVANSEGLNATEHDAIVKLAMKLVRATTVGKVSYGTEAGLFATAGIPSVVIGPGDIAEAHRPNEFVDLEQLAHCETFLDSLAVDHALVA